MARIAASYTRVTSPSGDSPKWAAMPVPIWVNNLGSFPITNGSDFAAVQAALTTWENVASAAVQFDYRGPTTAQTVGYDGINLITFSDDTTPLGSSTIAATFSFYTTNNNTLLFSETDISFNPALAFSTSEEAGKFDIQSILTHELGHVLGLDHAAMISSVMTPYSQTAQVDQRTLSYDDIAGISEIYPKTSGTPSVGQIEGFVLQGALGAFGAHVVAVDQNGTAWVSTLAGPTGLYLIRFVPPGTYRVYAEPLDLPVTEQNIGGGYYTNLTTNFETTYYGDVATFGAATPIQVVPGQATSINTIHVLPQGPTGLNLTRPAFAARMGRGANELFTLGGADLIAGTFFTSSSPGVLLGPPTYGGSISSVAASSASMPVTIASSAALGPTYMTATSGTDTSVLSGAVVIVDQQPGPQSLFPASGPTAGGTAVTISGSNFRPGAMVYFGGLAAPSVTIASATVISATTPTNIPGSANIVIVNADGTNGLLSPGFVYVPPTPSITGITPASGPPATAVTIDGNQFDTHPQNIDVEFNGTQARVVSASATQIVALVPYGATSGPVTVSAFGVNASGSVSFNVTAPPPSTNHAADTDNFVDLTDSASAATLTFTGPDPNDDGLATVQLPFTFSLFNDIYLAGSGITVSTNGWVSLEPVGDPYTYQNGPLPGASAIDSSGIVRTIPPSLIAPFYDDLALVPAVSSVRTAVFGSSPNREFVVQWSQLTILDEAGTDLNANITFEAILYEGSSDIQFVYPSVSGPRSDASSATIGIQNLARNQAVMTSFNQSKVVSGYYVTYHFNQGVYTAKEGNPTPPSTPVVIDGGALTSSATELFAAWTSQDTVSGIHQYQYSIFGTAGSSAPVAIVPATTTTANSVDVTGLNLQVGVTYYFSVTAVNNAGLTSPSGVSDGIQYDPTFQPDVKIIPSSPENTAEYSGIALQAPSAMSVVLKAMDGSGNLITGPGVLNPITVSLAAGRQSALLIQELFGLSTFDGWIQVEASTTGLGVFTATGAWDMSSLDGSVPHDPSTDFVLFHPGASAIFVNPSIQTATVTITDLVTLNVQTITIAGRAKLSMPVGGISRVHSSEALSAIESFDNGADLGLGTPVPVSSAQSSLIIPDGVTGEGYTTILSLANVTNAMVEARPFRLAGRRRLSALAPNAGLRVSLADLLQLPAGSMVSDAVRVSATAPLIGTPSAALLGVVDIENPTGLVSIGAPPAATDVVFPQVANGNGLFTGLCIVTGNLAATVTIDVYDPNGDTPKSATFTVGANQQIARLVSELVTTVTTQIGGYIRIHSDQPIWTWEIYGSGNRIMASGPTG